MLLIPNSVLYVIADSDPCISFHPLQRRMPSLQPVIYHPRSCSALSTQYSVSIQLPSRRPSVSQNPFAFWVFRQMRILSYGQLAAIVWKFSQNSQRVRIAIPLLDQILLFAMAYFTHRHRVLEGKLYQPPTPCHHQPESGVDRDPAQRDSGPLSSSLLPTSYWLTHQLTPPFATGTFCSSTSRTLV